MPRSLYPSSLLRQNVRRRTESTVFSGPFRGMRYLGYSTYGAYIPKLIGTYERELNEVLEQALAKEPAHVVDVGGAEGYYAVGILRRLKSARVTVFEMSEEGRRAITELARLNGVSERLEIRGRCTPAELDECLARSGASLVIVDVEGYEVELLDPNACPHIVQCDVLVEVHDFKVAGCAERVLAQMKQTHEAATIRQAARAVSEYPFRDVWAQLFPNAILRYGLNEFRHADNWWIWFRRGIAHAPLRA